MSSAVQKVEEATSLAHVNSGAMTPMEMLNAAIMRGDSIDKLERLMDLNDRWEKAQAKKAFIEAKATFKANAPTIFKDMENKQYGSRYSSIGNVVNPINAELSKHGFDARWDFDQGEKTITVTCVLTHMAGHSERVSLAGPPDTSGSKNPIQQIKSTTTYLKLATFEAVTGITTKDGNKDDDGNSASAQSDLVTPDQAEAISKKITEVGANIDAFLKMGNVESISEIRACDFDKVMNLLEMKKRARK
jgi:hypothetical protein